MLRAEREEKSLEAAPQGSEASETEVSSDNACELCVYAMEQIQNGGLPACGGGGQRGPSPTRYMVRQRVCPPHVHREGATQIG